MKTVMPWKRCKLFARLCGRTIGSCPAKWRINPEDGEAYYKQQLEKYGRNEKLIGYYTYELLLTSRWDDAAKALEGFEDSTDQTIQENFQWLKERD